MHGTGGRRIPPHSIVSCQIARPHELPVVSPRPGWEWDETMGRDRMQWPVVRSAGELLRQWCDMAECGNVAKVRRFRQKGSAGR